jgi:hypothetical protein
VGEEDFLGILINYGTFGIPKDPRPKKFTDVGCIGISKKTRNGTLITLL